MATLKIFVLLHKPIYKILYPYLERLFKIMSETTKTAQYEDFEDFFSKSLKEADPKLYDLYLRNLIGNKSILN